MNRSDSLGIVVPVVSITELHIELPFYESISAGFPSPADDYLEQRLSLDEHLIKNPSSTFFIRVQGDSMVNAGIYPDDILIVDRSLRPKSSDVIVAVVENEFTVKRLVKTSEGHILKAEHPDYPPILLNEEVEFMVWGVVTNVIHKPYEL